MKKILALILMVCMVSLLAGCGSNISNKFGVAKEGENERPEIGTVEGNLYKSSYGIEFEKPDSWEYATVEELASIETQAGVYYDMLCQDLETGSHILVMYENLIDARGTLTITEDEYIETVSNSLYNGGLMEVGRGETSVSGKAFKYIEAYGEAENVSLTQGSYIRKEGNIMISVIVAAFNDDDLTDIMKCFK